MLSATNLKDLEELLLFNPISYCVSLNVGYFGNDLDQLKTDWTTEYFDDTIRNLKKSDQIARLFNYELSPNESNSNMSLISKHCIINGFYYHVNW